MVEWKQERDKLFCGHLGVKVMFQVPDYFDLREVHPDILKLCEWLMFWPWDKDIIKDYKWTRKMAGPNVSLAYSGGVDSTAALTLLDTYDELNLSYMQREWLDDGMLKQANPLYSIEQVDKIRGKKTDIIKTDFEKIRYLIDKKMIGFSTDLCVCIGSILLADYQKTGYIATGMMLESTYLQRGYEYRDFVNSDYWKRHTETFEKAGFELMFPVIPCSEILTNIIAEGGRYYGIGNSCIRSIAGGRHCMSCYKCYRKNMINGKVIPLNREADRFLSHPQIKQGASLIYAYNNGGYGVKQLDKYKKLDYSFLEDYYGKGLECLPEKFYKYIKERLEIFSEPMTYDLSKFVWGKE